jgi:glutamyl-tRNA reductase
VNRKPERAAALAAAWGGNGHAWSDLPSLLSDADVLFVATGAAHPLVSAGELAGATHGRIADRRLVVLDLSVPRNVEPEARGVPGIELFDLEDLQRLCCPAAGTPSAALDEAERLLDEEIGRLGQALYGRAAAPRLAELHRLGAEVAAQETAWALAQLDDLSDQERGVVREMADRLVRRVLYPVSRSLREPGGEG